MVFTWWLNSYNPDIKYSRNKLDFGKGFYVTPIEEQAVSWVSRFK
ncbi:MAG: DUF3990 domain-containing protein, partial [Streptococcus sp.]